MGTGEIERRWIEHKAACFKGRVLWRQRDIERTCVAYEEAMIQGELDLELKKVSRRVWIWLRSWYVRA